MTMFLVIVTSLCLLVALITFIGVHGNKSQKHLNTPPGSTGWPIFGETTKLVAPWVSTSLGEFVETRIKRYGKVFKTSIMGTPTIVSADPELNQFVLQNDGKLFEGYWPGTLERLLGLTSKEDKAETHRSLKNIFHFFLSIPYLRKNFLRTFELYTLEALQAWKVDTPFSVDVFPTKITFHMILGGLLSMKAGEEVMEELWRAHIVFSKGFSAIPIYLPRTRFGKAMKSRKAMLGIIGRIVEERKKKKTMGCDEVGESDYLGLLLERSNMNDEKLVNHILGMIYAGSATTSRALSTAIYFLGKCPEAIQELKKEHKKIARVKKEREESGLIWDDFKCMEFTHCVINETLRLGNAASLYRKVKMDTKFKGYDIPKGWSIITLLAAPHLDENTFEEPHTFNPWRWQKKITTKMTNSFMPFGHGLHKCAGVELTKMELAIFLHYVVLRYEWEVVEGSQPLWRNGSNNSSNGLLIKVTDVSPLTN